MSTKTISISVELYNFLEKMRLPDEQIDDTIFRLCGIKKRDPGFESRFRKALDEVVREDSELLERLAQ